MRELPNWWENCCPGASGGVTNTVWLNQQSRVWCPGIGTTEIRTLGGGVQREVIRIPDLIGAIAETACVAKVTRHAGSYGFTTLDRSDSAELPAAQESLCHTASIRHKAAASPHGKLIQVAEGKTMAQVGSHRTMLQIGAIGILNEASYVAISIAQVFGESVGREKVETIGKPFVQRGLEGIVEHLQLWEVERQNRRHIGLLIEISAAKVRKRAVARGIRPAEIGVENLRGLVEITSLMVPQMVSPSTYVADLSDRSSERTDAAR